MISDQVPKFFAHQFDRPSNVRGKTEPYSYRCILWAILSFCQC